MKSARETACRPPTSIMPTAGKIAWIEALKAAGLSKVQAGSFVPPKLLPQMADSAEVVRAAKAMGGFTRLGPGSQPKAVPRTRWPPARIELNFVHLGLRRRTTCKNVRKTRAESLEEFRQDRRPAELAIRSTARVTAIRRPGHLFRLHHRRHSRPEGIVYALGRGLCSRPGPIASGSPTPSATAIRFRVKQEVFLRGLVLRSGWRPVPVGAHFHDTRGLGLANAFAATGSRCADELDGCLGGLGGCPYAPGATGNVVTEDLVFMLEAMGLRTGIDLDKTCCTRGRSHGATWATSPSTAPSSRPGCPRASSRQAVVGEEAAGRRRSQTLSRSRYRPGLPRDPPQGRQALPRQLSGRVLARIWKTQPVEGSYPTAFIEALDRGRLPRPP